ncbi:MAG TPA: alpha/beta hydrolase [Rhizomicrobium sp.]|jgi:pimeloyl-ACP methyl ester carboxylesterase
MRWVYRGLIAFVVLVVLAIGYRAWRQHENEVALAIDTPNGVEEASFLGIGGIDQWVQIRGENRDNPVILFVHGGPGSSETPLSSLFRPWEKYFTVVMWDQRCAGKTFARNGAESCKALSIAGAAHDGEVLASYLRRRLRTDKIAVLGHSWGTMVGLRMVKDRPDLFRAYVGTGQVVSIAQKETEIYARTMARLRAARDEAGIAALRKAGPPPYRSFRALMVERGLSARTDIPSERDLMTDMIPVGAFAPGWSPWDVYEFFQASGYAEAATFDADASYDARALGPKFAMPIFIVEGAADNITPADLAKPYLDSLDAPHKEFIVIPGAGHSAVLTKPDAFLEILRTRVRPILR